MSVDVYSYLIRAWELRMSAILCGDLNTAQNIWGDAYRKFYGQDTSRIEWRARDEGGADCIVAGTMYFEDTASRLVRVPK